MKWTRLWILGGALLALSLSSACAGRFEGRRLRFHDTREVTRSPAQQEGGRAVTSPPRRTSAARPRGEVEAHHPLESERMDVDRYRVFIQTVEDERRQRYGPTPTTTPKRRRGGTKGGGPAAKAPPEEKRIGPAAKAPPEEKRRP